MKIISRVSILIVGLTIGLLFIFPILKLFSQGIDQTAFFDSVTLSIVRFTCFQALVSTTLSVVVGTPLGVWASRNSKVQKFTYLFLAIPFGVSSLVAGLSWVLILGKSGPLGFLDISYSAKALIFAHLFFNIPWVALQVAMARDRIPSIELEAARSLGSSRPRLFFSWMLPRLKWDVLNSASQVFSFCMMSFALVLLLGGGPPVETLETSIYSSIRLGELDLPAAISFSLWELLLNLFPWAFILIAQKKIRRLSSEISLKQDPTSSTERIFVILASSLFLLPYFYPLFTTRFPFLFSAGSFVSLKSAAWLSFQLAVLAAAGALLLSICWMISIRSVKHQVLKNILGLFASLPTSISVLVFGLSFFLAYARWINPFEGSFFSIVCLQSILFLPIAFRWLWPVTLSEDREALDAAESLGANPTRAFMTVEWPKWKVPLILVFAMIATCSLGEVGAVSLFYSETLIPLPLLIARLTQQYRFEEAQALAMVLLLLGSLSISILWLFSKSKIRLN
jgi:thiamine transport system permease protein